MIAASMSATSRPDLAAVPPVVAAMSTPAGSVPHAAQVAKPNPSAQLDLTLGITVLTFHDASGAVVATTPTQQQLNTYLLFGTAQHAAAKSAASSQASSGVAMTA